MYHWCAHCNQYKVTHNTQTFKQHSNDDKKVLSVNIVITEDNNEYEENAHVNIVDDSDFDFD